MFRILLPRARAWSTTTQKRLRELFLGLEGFAGEVRKFIDDVYADLLPPTTRELPRWEDQFGLPGQSSEAIRRLELATAWLMNGGQSPDYLQSIIWAAGFPQVYVHEWWESGPPYVPRDPRDHTDLPLVGEYQCEGSTPWECFEAGPGLPLAPHCDDSLANDPGYIVNLDLTRRAPPAVPDDPARWPYFLYVAGETFPDPFVISTPELARLKALLLKVCPTQQWIVYLATIVDAIKASGGAELGALDGSGLGDNDAGLEAFGAGELEPLDGGGDAAVVIKASGGAELGAVHGSGGDAVLQIPASGAAALGALGGSGSSDSLLSWSFVLARGNNSGQHDAHIDTGRALTLGDKESVPASTGAPCQIRASDTLHIRGAEQVVVSAGVGGAGGSLSLPAVVGDGSTVLEAGVSNLLMRATASGATATVQADGAILFTPGASQPVRISAGAHMFVMSETASSAFAVSAGLGAYSVANTTPSRPRFTNDTDADSLIMTEAHLSASLDAVFGSTRGSLLRRGASGWELITPGTVDLPLVSNGAGADPAYERLTLAALPQLGDDQMWTNISGGVANAAARNLSAMVGGGLVWNSTTHRWEWDGSSNLVTGWSGVLAKSRFSGANSPVIDSGQHLYFGDPADLNKPASGDIRKGATGGALEINGIGVNIFTTLASSPINIQCGLSAALSLTGNDIVATASGGDVTLTATDDVVLRAASLTESLTLGSNGLLQAGGSPYFMQAQSAPTSIFGAAHGVWWVENTSPTRPKFNDSIGKSWSLAYAMVSGNATLGTVINNTAALNLTGTFTVPANSSRVGTKYRMHAIVQFLRGATATALNVRVSGNVAGAEQATTGNIPATTTAGQSGTVNVEMILTVLSLGAGGTAYLSIEGNENIRTGNPFNKVYSLSTAPFAFDTTANNTLNITAAMGTAVAGTVLTNMGGYIQPLTS